MKKLYRTLALAAALFAAPSAAHAQYTYVGSWVLGDGPIWTGQPTVYTGQEAAALIFGGAASNYVISTMGSSTSAIDFMAWVDTWGGPIYKAAQNYSLDAGAPGYTPGDVSAYVCDHSYVGPGNYCDPGTNNTAYTNYAFAVTATPEPASLALVGTGLLAIGGIARRRSRASTK